MDFKYIAGFIDADGNLYVDYHINKDKTKMTLILILKISIGQKHPIILFNMKNFTTFGSVMYNKNLNTWTYYITGNEALSLLKQLVSYLVVKQEQAKEIIRMFNKDRGIEYNKDIIETTRRKITELRHKFIISNANFSYEWFGGFFDGDGYIGGYKSPKCNNVKINCSITVDKKDIGFSKWLASKLGFKIYHKLSTSLDLVINSNHLLFLRLLRQNTICKKAQISNCIDWIVSLNELPKPTSEECLYIVNKLKSLKIKDCVNFDKLHMNDYQRWTRCTVKYPKNQAINYLTLGLTGEAGEIANKIKKIIRDKTPIDDNFREIIAGELGDVLYYLARLSDELKLKLSSIGSYNILKLTDRLERGKIQGSGDNR